MSVLDYMQLFQHMDPETKEQFSRFVGEALQSGHVSHFLKDRMKRLIVDDPWPYELLGISRGATASEVNAAHRRTIAKLHPDKHDGDDRFFKLASRARDIALAGARR